MQRGAVIPAIRIAVCLLALGCSTVPAPERRRLQPLPVAGHYFTIDGILPRPVQVFVSPAAASSRDLVVHFHGASFIPFQSVDASQPIIVASVHLGAGSSAYERPFNEPDAWSRLFDAVQSRVGPIGRVHLTAFSAGYGAVRAILPEHADRIDSLLLLDGLHTGYTQDCGVEVVKMEPFVSFASRALTGEKRFVITHSEIAPVTYASTTDTADYLLTVLGVPRLPVRRVAQGMLQRSEARRGGLLVMGFAGHTAPDHTDHFHAMPGFLRLCFGADSGGS